MTTTAKKLRIPQYIATTAKRTIAKLGEGWQMTQSVTDEEDCIFIHYEFTRNANETIGSWAVEHVALMAKTCEGNWYITTDIDDPTKLMIRVYLIIHNK